MVLDSSREGNAHTLSRSTCDSETIRFSTETSVRSWQSSVLWAWRVVAILPDLYDTSSEHSGDEYSHKRSLSDERGNRQSCQFSELPGATVGCREWVFSDEVSLVSNHVLELGILG